MHTGEGRCNLARGCSWLHSILSILLLPHNSTLQTTPLPCKGAQIYLQASWPLSVTEEQTHFFLLVLSWYKFLLSVTLASVYN